MNSEQHSLKQYEIRITQVFVIQARLMLPPIFAFTEVDGPVGYLPHIEEREGSISLSYHASGRLWTG